jgi:protein FAM50
MGDFQANFHRPDTGIHTVEGNVAGSRAAGLEKKRARDQEEFEQRKRQIAADARSSSTSIHSKFAEGSVAAIQEQSFKTKTVGLVSAADFKAAALAAEQPVEEEVVVESAQDKAAREKAAKKARKKKLKEKRKMMSTLSFAGDEVAQEWMEEETTRDENEARDTVGSDEKPVAAAAVAVASMKNPAVDTSFLPDKARDEEAASKRKRLELQWKINQAAMKEEKLQITYSYWDGSGHRRELVCKKGDTVADFLEQVRKDLSGTFRELNTIAADALLYVKEDLIIPQDLTFYDLIATKARGKSGPLFHFDVHDDVRIGSIDTRIEKDESHPGKVVERRWYERNKHIFPASRWELYDPTTDYGGYSIHGGQVNKKKDR